jgi:outer membrane receptor protein involved in Fe transport
MNRLNQRTSCKLRLAACLALSLLAVEAGFGQSQTNLLEVSGAVFDPSGAVLTEAKVTLHNLAKRAEQSKTTDRKGQFRFARVASGAYEIEVQKEGFKPSLTQLTVGTTVPAPLQIVLPIAELRADTAVVDQSNQVSTNPDENLNVIKLDRAALKNLPVLGNDVIGALANLLDAGSTGSGGATVIVDGLESKKKKIPASQIQEVRINQNPYSAEFSRPGRGRIEVITKVGSPEYHGEFDFSFRDHHLDARNAFARERPPEQRRIFDGNLSGPIFNGKKTTFLFGVAREEEDLQSVVFAETPSGIVLQNVAYPNRDTELSLRVNHQFSDKTTISIRYEHTFDSAENGGVGGFNLPEVATNSAGRDHELYFTHRRVISPKLINEFTLHVGSESGSTRGVRSGARRIVVLDAFTGGGSQVDRRSTVTQIQLNEIATWNQGKHFVKAGLNIPDITRRGSSDRSNFIGTFSFSTLADYLNNRPFSFSVNQGDGHLVFWQRDFGLFVQDNMLVRPNFSVGLGLRYDWQNYLGDENNFAPRLSFAYAPGKQRKTVLRGGAGIFYDRTGGGPISDILRFNGQRLRQVTLSNPGYPDPLSTGGTLAAKPSNIVRFAPEIRSPYTLQANLGVERQITKALTVTAGYINTRSFKLFRSRDLNAPFPPSEQRPNPLIGVLRQVESAAHAQSHALELVLRGKVTRFFNGTAQYTLGRAYNNASGVNALPANNYDLTLEWSRAEFDERQRFNLLGTVEASDWFKLGLVLSLISGRPYNLTTGRDDNHDTVANDRPAGVRRNSLPGPGTATLDVRWSKEFELKKTKNGEGPTMTVGVGAFNVFNRVNFANFVGNLSSPFFGRPVAARPARRMQLSFGFTF